MGLSGEPRSTAAMRGESPFAPTINRVLASTRVASLGTKSRSMGQAAERLSTVNPLPSSGIWRKLSSSLSPAQRVCRGPSHVKVVSRPPDPPRPRGVSKPGEGGGTEAVSKLRTSSCDPPTASWAAPPAPTSARDPENEPGRSTE